MPTLTSEKAEGEIHHCSSGGDPDPESEIRNLHAVDELVSRFINDEDGGGGDHCAFETCGYEGDLVVPEVVGVVGGLVGKAQSPCGKGDSKHMHYGFHRIRVNC